YDDDVAKTGMGAVGYHMIAAGNGSGVIYGDGHGQMFTNVATATQLMWTDQATFNISGGVWAYDTIFTTARSRVDPVTRSFLVVYPKSEFLDKVGVAVSTSDSRVYYVTWDAVTNKRILSFNTHTAKEYPFTDTGLIAGDSKKLVACDNHTVAFCTTGAGVTPELVIVRDLP
ncbi:MAG TPA: hypothetical protein VG944_03480, partial [Fimbriimonas sp.]|nr:hypothetical protein [Fimbriimonas sp.]